MKNNRSLIAVLLLIAVTAITLYTSVQHHRTLVSVYGDIANVFVPLIAISSFLLGALIALVFQWGINVLQFEHVVKLLPAPERTVLTALFTKRTMVQEAITSETGMSRLMVSRVITRLEEKGVVTKKHMGTTNMIESKLYRRHSSTQLLTRLPGLSEERVIIVIAIVFLFGLSISILNSFHVLVLEHPLEPALYLLAIEFFALGGLANFLFRKKIASAQFDKILGVLSEDERTLLRAIYSAKSISQSELVNKTGIYKMKASRILEKFRQRGVIDKKPQGYTNAIISKI
jgi:uncharacterized membrane protein